MKYTKASVCELDGGGGLGRLGLDAFSKSKWEGHDTSLG